MDNIFDKLLHLPLFQGLTKESLENTIEKIPFHFLKYIPAQLIIGRDEQCEHLRFVISGNVSLEYESRLLKFRMTHRLEAPEVIVPDYLFGLNTACPYTVRALDNCGILQLAKGDYMTMLQTDKVFLLNILNYLSRNSQIVRLQMLNTQRTTPAQKLAILVNALTSQHAKDITIFYRQRDMCQLLGTRRPAFITAMNYLNEEGLIQLHENSIITIPDRKALLRHAVTTTD